ncbi:MAG: acetyl/propionyl/methylcrotonyl-CoA carboxylase subunit alpha [Hahellaceae bacterium]|nr:acetyl/propionyl/methylcrotonyl-CoA carboxylase subunit alpha [Hahellaceae bacterium]
MFTKILIANRGEIACRVMRSARALGYRTVAVFSEADRHAPHVSLADEAVLIGPAPVGQSYLRAEAILDACRKTGADAVHPGYGFLSENCTFADKCQAAGITFIGPPVNAIELMGSKRLSKIAMIEADVPCIPGYEGADQNEDTLIREARRIGFPVMIKASAGGGGRGMRLVFEDSELAEQIRTARSEATNAFGSGELIIEKALIEPRHIEIQVFADTHGNAVYLGERDCSIQRRHQKVVEEAPSPFVDEDLRQRMGKAAVQAALSCQYVGAGTVEFLVDRDRNFYFLEMNTRLQVEHPVTELVTGFDLVEWQIKVAAGQRLPVSQEEVKLRGHAIEVRLYAEDPATQFMPQTGQVYKWQPAQGVGVRIDDGIRTDQVISPHYDPMIAKVIAYGEDREEARRRLVRAVQDCQLFGVTNNQHFLANILQHPEFAAGHATTAFIGQHFVQDVSMQPPSPSQEVGALASLLFYHHQHRADAPHFNWWSANHSPWPCELACGNTTLELNLYSEGGQRFSISCNANATERTAARDETRKIDITVVTLTHETLRYELDGVQQTLNYLIKDRQLFLHRQGVTWTFQDKTHQPAEAAAGSASGVIKASMDGAIVNVLVNAGDTVRKGQTLVILEAMKMEHPLKADRDGTVERLQVKAGDQVKIRQVLVTLAPEDAHSATEATA